MPNFMTFKVQPKGPANPLRALIAGLDPAIHADLPLAADGCASAWTTGSSPVVTK
jgi:hypothetical protein